MVISGSVGKYALINGIYEPMGLHGNLPCWVTRSTNPCYIFHTGKTRWVISKELDDGQTCYAFIADDGGGSPAACSGTWTRCNDRGEWNQDPALRCRETGVSSNAFVQMRMNLEAEMQKLKIISESDRSVLWKKIDVNGDGCVDLAEVEALVGELVKSGTWPSWLGHEVALERAYTSTLNESIDGDDQIQKEEFHALLLNIFWFGKLHDVYLNIARSDDELSYREFVIGMEQLGIHFPPDKAEEEFRSFDTDNSGVLNFAEFCIGVRKQVCPDEARGPDQTALKTMQMTALVAQHGGAEATAGTMVRTKTFSDFDKLERKLKAMANDKTQNGLQKMWRRIDYNGNNKVSLAEIDKWVVENYPLLNHKPALIRAMQATLDSFHDMGGLIEKKEFKALLLNLFYYNKLFWLFDQADADNDRRMDVKEFSFCCTMCGLKMSPRKVKAEFAKVDRNGGGIILFDEFCKYFVEKQCPKEMTAFLADA